MASSSTDIADQSRIEESHRTLRKIWYRSSLFNAFVIGGVGFIAPGLWNAMASLGAGGEEKPFLVNAANALVFALSMLLLLHLYSYLL